jgi:Glyceraldehyde-3-phosphate dehydrogenase/erythrose-4-phosphate dehydrogenase
MIKVGINGFGRIGRAIFRINNYNQIFEVTAINDIDPLIENHVYLVNYDSIYGSLKNHLSVSNDKKYIIKGKNKIAFYSKKNIDEIP